MCTEVIEIICAHGQGDACFMTSPSPEGDWESRNRFRSGGRSFAEEPDEIVLVVNDVPDQLDLMSTVLRESGYTVVTAVDGLEGYEGALASRPDIIISDVSMPRIDGIEMCRLIREHAELQTTPILLASAIRKDSESVVAGLKAGADDYLEAPYNPMRLVAKVARLLERKRGEAALRKSEEQFLQAQKMEAIGLLAGGVAHDFNNLLTAIMGYSDLALKSLDEVDPLRSHIEEIKKSGIRAASLTRQLLAFSRKQVLQPQILDLNAVVADMAQMLPRLIGENIILRTAFEPALGSVKADPGQIEQVILNLAVNARDAMPEGGTLTIETDNAYLDESYAQNHNEVIPGPYVVLAVSDTGSGMSGAIKARIFEPFFTTKMAGKGTGLGLSTVYGIVKQSGGHIWVYSEIGTGTVFKIYMPRVDLEAEEYRNIAEATEVPKGRETILVVEDEEMLRNLSREILEFNGYKVLVADSGAAALQICEQYPDPIHLLLTDVVMPGISGRSLAERAIQIRPDLLILYTSGYTDDTIVHHGVIEEGANFIHKPFSVDSLSRKVRDVFDKIARQ